MSKKVKYMIIAGMVTSMLLTPVSAKEVGNVSVSVPKYPISQGISGNSASLAVAEMLGETNEDKVLNEADDTVTSYFTEANERLKQYAQSEDFETLKREAKNVFTDGIDFLFFDGEIDGFTRKQMTEEGKKSVINSLNGTLEFLDEYFPGFSDTFGRKYKIAKSYLDERFVGFLDLVKNWIGEDTYDGIGNMGHDFFKDLGTLWNTLGDAYQKKIK